MIVATDVQYDDARGTALAAAVVFADWTDAVAADERTLVHAGVAPYVPGSFYLRELPCILPLLEAVARAHPVEVVVVDGYVDLGDQPGLGRHLFGALAALPSPPAIVGVAKHRYATASAVEVLRGSSQRPLFVTAHGLDPARAAAHVARMHGEHRIPTLLKRVDALARGVEVPRGASQT